MLEAREEAMQQLDALPGSELPANAASKIAHAGRIKADLDLLEELVAQRGSTGDTVLPRTHCSPSSSAMPCTTMATTACHRDVRHCQLLLFHLHVHKLTTIC